MRNEALTSEAASLADQLALLDKSEKELQLDRARKLEEMSDLRQRLEVAERREEQAEELARLRSLLSDMSAEHERLQQRLAEGQEEIDRLVQQQQQQPLLQPPPDVTAGGPAVAAGSQHQQQQQPDVAALRGQHGNPPDLMPGVFTIRTYIQCCGSLTF
jgi:chromosome segregation ATPase